MTGIERLRELADSISPIIPLCGVTKSSYDRSHIEMAGARLRGFLADIADQIERETKPKRHTAEYASVSAYDPPSQEDREAIAWVREHGGLERVKAQRREFMPRSAYERKKAGFLDHIAECERALGRRNERIKELNHRACDLTRENAERGETIRKLSDRAAKQSDEIRVMRDVIAETCARLGVEGTGSTVDDAQVIWREIARRLMPDGMCWPVFEDGGPVRIGDFVSDVEVRSVVFRDGGILLSDCTSVPGWGTWRSYKEPIKRPEPKVLDADGAEIRVGDTVYDVEYGCELVVTKVTSDAVFVAFEDVEADKYDASQLTHRGPVLAADGKPLREGETVWDVSSGIEFTVIGLPRSVEYQAVKLRLDDGAVTGLDPDRLTHERPDSWERIEEDADALVEAEDNGVGSFSAANDYCERHGLENGTVWVMMARDLVRRCRALAERGQ